MKDLFIHSCNKSNRKRTENSGLEFKRSIESVRDEQARRSLLINILIYIKKKKKEAIGRGLLKTVSTIFAPIEANFRNEMLREEPRKRNALLNNCRDIIKN